jgi:AcrR family transcriptional regulator
MMGVVMARARARLDHAAIAVAFAPDGLHGVTAADVAARAGVAKPTLYAHGRSKDAVFLACVEAETERLLDRLYDAEQRTRDLTPSRRAGALALAIVQHGSAAPHSARLLHVTGRHASSTVARAVDAALDRLPARVGEALRCEPERALALYAAAAALAVQGVDDPYATAALLGDAFGAGLEPASDGGDEGVASVGIY